MDFRYVDSSLSAAAAQNGGATGSAGAGGSNGHSDHTLNVNIAPAHRGSADFGRLHSPITLASMMGTVPRSPYAQPLPAPDGATGPGDRKRQTQSCDRCRAKKRRCDCAFPTCSNCLKAGAECTMLLEQKKRGPKRASGAAPGRSSNKRNNSLYDVPSPVPANRGLPVLAPEPRESSVAASEEDAPMNDPADLFQSDSFFEIRGSNVIGSFSGDESIGHSSPTDFGLALVPPIRTRSPSNAITPDDSSLALIQTIAGANSSPNNHNKSPSTEGHEESDNDLMKELWSLFPRSSSGSVTSNSPQAIGSPSMSSRLMQFAGFDFSNIDPSTLFDPASGLVFPGADLRLNIPQNPSTSFGQLARVNLDRNTLDSLQGDPLLALTGAGPATERIPVCRITALPSVDVERPGLPKGLTVADLPDIPADFYVHLITIFFSYFHQALPIINERQFFIEIMPENTHHAMLLNAIYAIGCLFSRHSTLFQAPFYGPHRASEYFANRAAGLIPTFAKTMSSFEKVSICQAALLLSVLDYGSRNAVRSWMYTGMGCRLSQKLDLPFSRTVNDFFSICNGVPKPAVVSSMEERKRVWWASFVIDTYVSISTGMNFLLNENDYFESLVDVEHLLSHDGAKFSGGDPVPSPPNSGSWVDIFCNKPYPTVFDSGRGMQDPVPVAASEVLSSTEETLHLVQLCFIIRKVFRFNKFPKNTTPSLTPNSVLLASLLSRPMDVNRLHDTLICWYEGLPSSFRLFDVLDRKPSFPLSSPKMTKPSSLCITVNLLFFTAVVLLHYRNLKKVDGAGLSPIQADSSFRMSSNGLNTSLYTSAEVCAVAYKCQCQIVRIAYGGTNATPSPSSRPPPELVSCPLVQCFLLPVATALLSQFQYGSQLTSLDVRPLSDYSTQLESLHALFLPVLDNIAQVWPTARSYAANLRSQSQIFREKWKGLL